MAPPIKIARQVDLEVENPSTHAILNGLVFLGKSSTGNHGLYHEI